MTEPKYVVARNAAHGVGLAELVEYDGDEAVVRRLKGQRYRMSRPQTFKPVRIPKADVLREATRRELQLGHPDMSAAPPLRVVSG